MTASAFDQLPLKKELLTNLESLGYLQMTQVQAEALPRLLAGEDLVVQAQTGSGKTAAFALGLLQSLEEKDFSLQGLVLCPTRELADQVAEEIRRLARQLANIKVLTLCGGQPFGPQVQSLKHGAHLLVATPGRLLDHLQKGNLQVDQVRQLVLDEADRMLDMGFQEPLEALLEALPRQRQTLLFSATYPPGIASLAKAYLQQPGQLKVQSSHQVAEIEQHFYRIGDASQRYASLEQLLLHYQPASCMIFCTTRKETQSLAEGLRAAGFSALALHGELEQKDRDQVWIQFSNHSASLLVATDVAARGLDMSALDLVVNYSPALDPEVHVHRVGRTGRAGEKGLALTLVAEEEAFRFEILAEYLDADLSLENLPPVKMQARPEPAPMQTLMVDGGKKQKLRPGDLLGALTADPELEAAGIGKIQIKARQSYVALPRNLARQGLSQLQQGKLKGKNFRVRLLKS
ncbi:ATP-dependent RNA helicase DbpA [Marinospirillum perlucidum]|uniref:ATP-dependent RNA helicase DbpA n=1 Tax=Marinospirillum perlucidum TaxID=1982602 RepID=UPI000DF3303D|nr:ATP-dependent RNA helicase DbpA [Marinospirillum perlucidum]